MRALASFTFATLLTLIGLTIIVSSAVPASGEETEAQERVIVMKSGRVLNGFASRNAGGWLVEQSTGRVQVPEDEVRLVADSMVDAYRKLRDSVAEPTPTTHMTLAQWCISYRLHQEARNEVRRCLKLDPDHAAARKLLKRLDDMLDPPEPAPRPQDPKAKSIEGFLAPEVESLGGLSTESAVTFTQRIQPLLMNKCGNASCHGTTDPGEKREGFHLNPVRLGSSSHRLYTERNLAEVLRYVDLQEPAHSPLVTIPQGAHAGTAGVFHGTAGNTQLKMLRTWTKTVAEEKLTQEQELSGRPSILAKSRRPQMATQAAAAIPPEGETEPPLASEPMTVEAPPKPKLLTETNPAVAPQSRPQTSPPRPFSDPDATRLPEAKPAAKPANDPFDPDIFNRRFHSPSRK